MERSLSLYIGHKRKEHCGSDLCPIPCKCRKISYALEEKEILMEDKIDKLKQEQRRWKHCLELLQFEMNLLMKNHFEKQINLEGLTISRFVSDEERSKAKHELKLLLLERKVRVTEQRHRLQYIQENLRRIYQEMALCKDS